MSRETKLGIVVAVSFVGLLSAVIARKVMYPSPTPEVNESATYVHRDDSKDDFFVPKKQVSKSSLKTPKTTPTVIQTKNEENSANNKLVSNDKTLPVKDGPNLLPIQKDLDNLDLSNLSDKEKPAALMQVIKNQEKPLYKSQVTPVAGPGSQRALKRQQLVQAKDPKPPALPVVPPTPAPAPKEVNTPSIPKLPTKEVTVPNTESPLPAPITSIPAPNTKGSGLPAPPPPPKSTTVPTVNSDKGKGNPNPAIAIKPVAPVTVPKIGESGLPVPIPGPKQNVDSLKTKGLNNPPPPPKPPTNVPTIDPKFPVPNPAPVNKPTKININPKVEPTNKNGIPLIANPNNPANTVPETKQIPNTTIPIVKPIAPNPNTKKPVQEINVPITPPNTKNINSAPTINVPVNNVKPKQQISTMPKEPMGIIKNPINVPMNPNPKPKQPNNPAKHPVSDPNLTGNQLNNIPYTEIIVTGDSPKDWDTISKEIWENPRFGRALWEFNKLTNRFIPDRVKPGTKIRHPNSVDGLNPRYIKDSVKTIVPKIAVRTPQPVNNQQVIKPAKVHNVGSPVSREQENYSGNGQVYVVREKNKMLYMIAREVLSDSRRWSEIYRLNPQIRPEWPIPPGTQLRMPMTSRVQK